MVVPRAFIGILELSLFYYNRVHIYIWKVYNLVSITPQMHKGNLFGNEVYNEKVPSLGFTNALFSSSCFCIALLSCFIVHR